MVIVPPLQLQCAHAWLAVIREQVLPRLTDPTLSIDVWSQVCHDVAAALDCVGLLELLEHLGCPLSWNTKHSPSREDYRLDLFVWLLKSRAEARAGCPPHGCAIYCPPSRQ